MTRNVTTTFRRSAEASFTDEAFLCFLTISHDSLDEPIRVNWDTVDHAHDGYNFIGFPFEITILSDDENPPIAQLTIQNIDPRIGDSIRLLNSPPRIKIEVISSVDFVGPLLAHFNGTDGSTTFVNSGDATPNPTLTAVGNAQIDDNSLLLDGTGDYVTVSSSSAFAVGSGDFSIKFKFNVSVYNLTASLQVLYDSGGFQYYIYLPNYSNSTILDESSSIISDEIGDPIYDNTVSGVRVFNSTAGTDIIASELETVVNTWYRVELTRSGGILKLFINGIQRGDDYSDTTIVVDTTPVIGGDHTVGFYFNGRIDEVAFISGNPTVIYSADKLFLINVSVDIVQVTGQIVGWDYLQRVWPGPRAQQSVFPGLFR